MQTESWDKKTGKYQIAVLLCWSKVMERAARAIVTGEEYKVKNAAKVGDKQSHLPDKEEVQDWLETQNLATMVGPRQYLDKYGNRWFLGVTARLYDDELSSSRRSDNKGIAEMFAQQMAAFCVWADVESYKMARQALESREYGNMEHNAVAESYAEKLTQMFRNKKVRGMQRLFCDEVVHPISQNKIYVTVYGISADASKTALEIEKINYATQVMDNRYQTVERGREAANKAAVANSKNRTEDFDKGYKQQSGAIQKEFQVRQTKKNVKRGTAIINKTPDQPVQRRKSTSGTFGGDVDVSNDF